MMSVERRAATIEDARRSIDAFRSRLLRYVDKKERCYTSILPMKVQVAAELSAYRCLDLAEASYSLLSQGHAIAAVIALRGSAESLAWLISISARARRVQDKASLHVLEDRVHRLAFGTRAMRWPEAEQVPALQSVSLNVLTVVDEAGDEYPQFRRWYDLMSEASHPAALGTLLAYASITDDYERINFNETAQLPLARKWAGGIDLAMRVGAEAHDLLQAAFPEFARQCDDLIRDA